MENSYSDSYKSAGVDITAGYQSIQLIKKHIERTNTEGVIGDTGGFGGLFALPGGYKEPVLISGTDGVGTKLKIASVMDIHSTIGIDCVAMCINDIICAGAKPLFFLDYIALGKNIPEKVERIVAGVAEGCVQAGCALVGGETAEHPGTMEEDEYDIAGFSVGIAEKSKIPDKNSVQEGDVIIALASSGVHSNGFSLIRKIFDVNNNPAICSRYFNDLGKTLGEELLTPTRIYVKSLLELFSKTTVRSVCHITGGGFYENIPRAFGKNLHAVLQKNAIPVPPIFNIIAAEGKINERDMYNTFNMGVGMCVIVPKACAEDALRVLKTAFVLGEIKSGGGGISLE
jgi:phosphoribosylformylglycinamidine cyclo-ligase